MSIHAFLGRLCALEKVAAPPALPFGTPEQAAAGTHRTWASGLKPPRADYSPYDDPFYKTDSNWEATGLNPGQLHRDRSINKAAYMHARWKSDNKARVAAGQAPLPLDTSKYFQRDRYGTPRGDKFFNEWARWRNPAWAMEQDVKKRIDDAQGPSWAIKDPSGVPYTSRKLMLLAYEKQKKVTAQRHKAQQQEALKMFPQIWSMDRRWRY